MIKKILWSIIWIFTLVWVSFWFQFFDVWLDKFSSNVDTNFDIWVLNKWRFLTTYIWTTKNVMAFSNEFMVWWYNWKLYLYDYTDWQAIRSQWFINYYQACDYFWFDNTWSALAWSNCSSPTVYEWSEELIWNFMWYIKKWDLVYYEKTLSHNGCGSYCTYWKYDFKICFSSDALWSSLCFPVSLSSTSMSPYGSQLPLSWSLDLNSNTVRFWNLPYSVIGDSPAFVGWSWNIDQWSSNAESVNVGWNVVYWQCTNWQAIQWYRSYIGISDIVCYWWLDNFSIYTWDYSVTPWKWLTVFDIYEWDNSDHSYSGFNDWLQSWAYNYEMYLNWQWLNTFDMYPTVFKTYFGILYRNFWPSRDVHDYCRLLLNSDLNWDLRDNSYIPSYVKDQLCEKIVNNNNVSNPWQWSNSSWTVVSSDWSWIWSSNVSWSNLSWWTPVYDWTDFINNYFNKLKWTYSDPTWSWNWILPWFIVIALLGVMFFKFIRK